jgi:hypothetical protein
VKPRIRQLVLRGNGLFLVVFGTLGLTLLDIPGIWFTTGPGASILNGAHDAGVGFVEAHGLAIITGAMFLWASRTPPGTAWHAVAGAVHALLGTANLLFWHSFTVGNVLWVGYLSTAAHLWFVLVHTVALRASLGGWHPRRTIRSR